MKRFTAKILRHIPGVLRRVLILFVCIFGLATSIVGQNTYRLSKAPYYKSFTKTKVQPGQPVARLPLAIDEKTQTEFFYQGREAVLRPLIEIIDHYIDSLQWTVPLAAAELPDMGKGAPYLFVGSAGSEIAPPGADMMREEFDKFPPMLMHIKKPSKEWKAAFAAELERSGTEYGLILWLGFNEYPKANKGLFKKKVVLGTGYEPEIRFLSAEDKPVEVLQLSGMIINRKGDVLKAGSEAFLYEDAPFWVQVLEAATSIDDNAIRSAVTEVRRDDLPGRPLAWQVATDHLLSELCQRHLVLASN